jgi:NAD(P)H-nitrite reductase large subunit
VAYGPGRKLVANGKVVEVRNHPKQDRTPVVTIAVPKKFAWVVRESKKGREGIMKDDRDLIICRCEEITKGEILEAMEMGADTLNEVKRLTRAGMGLCQEDVS